MEEMIEDTTEETAGAVGYPTLLEAAGLSGVEEAVG
jgi:hypothetical protein